MATTRRVFTREFKVQAVKLITEQGDRVCRGGEKEQAFRGQGVPPTIQARTKQTSTEP